MPNGWWKLPTPPHPKAVIADVQLGENLVVRCLRNHPPGDRAPSAVARLALVRDEVGVIAVLNFVPEGFDMFRH
jgi:hypothetical protein